MRLNKRFMSYAVLLTAFYVWMLLEGILRKWLIPGLSTPLFFMKYLIAILMAMVFILNRDKINKSDYPFIVIYLFFFFYCLLQIININVTNTPIVGIIGVLIHFGFSILIFIIPFVVNTSQSVVKIQYWICILLLPILALGILQYFSPPDSFLNRYANDDQYIALVGEHVRVTSIFSYISTYTSFLNFTILIIFYKVLQINRFNLINIVYLITLLLGIVNVFMTGSRGLVFLLGIQIALIYALLAVSFNLKKMIKLSLNFFLILFLGYSAITLTEEGNTAFDAFIQRVESHSDLNHRVQDAFDPFKFANTAGLVGFGIGTTYQGTAQFITTRWKMPAFWEEESERIVIELGLLGFLIAVTMRIAIFTYGIRTFFKVRDQQLKILSLFIVVHQLPTLLFFNQVTFNWMENIFYWTGVGILISINKIYHCEQEKFTNISIPS